MVSFQHTASFKEGISTNGSGVILGLWGIAVSGIIYMIGSIIYNIYFHPLASYPGPKAWAATPIPYVLAQISGRSPYRFKELHERYGRVVRVLPDELSYNTAEAWKDIYAYRNGHHLLPKDKKLYRPTILPSGEHVNSLSNNNHADHSRVRRLLSHGFSEKSLKGQEGLIQGYVNLLISKLYETSGNPVNLSKWYNFCTFDIIGDLVFGESFDCLETSAYHPWVRMIFDSIKAGTIITAVRRLPGAESLIGLIIPKSLKARRQAHLEMTVVKVQRRLEKKDERPDMLSHIINLIGDPRGMSEAELQANASLLILAGSETTATTLTAATYFICRYPEVKSRLFQEVRGTFATEEDIKFNSVFNLTYMLAVLNETMRLYPIVPSGLPRRVPEGGETIDGEWVPAHTAVSVQSIATCWSPENFFEPRVFHPERWLGDERFKADRLDASNPFSLGPRNCLGKNLAYAEMRTIFARMIWNFDMELAEDSLNWMDDQLVFALWDRGPLNVKLTPVVRS